MREQQASSSREAVQEKINTYWTIRSKTYDSSPGHGIGSDAEKAAWIGLLERLLPSGPSDVLDVGTGTGFLAFLAAELGHRVTGVDLSEGMLGYAQEKAKGVEGAPRFLIGDAVAPDFDAWSFDAVISRHVLWTLRDPEAAFKNWHRLLRPGGRVVIIDSLWFANDDDDKGASELQTEVAKAWAEAYSAETRASLPVMQMRSVEPVAELLRESGFSDVAVHSLEEVSVAEGRDQDQRYAIVATRAE